MLSDNESMVRIRHLGGPSEGQHLMLLLSSTFERAIGLRPAHQLASNPGDKAMFM